jgi:hypothetical protein
MKRGKKIEKQERKENLEENADGNGNNEMDNVCKKKSDSCTASILLLCGIM